MSTTTPADTENADASTDTRQVCDTAGQCSTAGPLSNIKIDRKKPSITVTNPASGAVFQTGQTVNAEYICADSGSGIAATQGCTGTSPVGSPIDTTTAGTKSFTVTANGRGCFCLNDCCLGWWFGANPKFFSQETAPTLSRPRSEQMDQQHGQSTVYQPPRNPQPPVANRVSSSSPTTQRISGT